MKKKKLGIRQDKLHEVLRGQKQIAFRIPGADVRPEHTVMQRIDCDARMLEKKRVRLVRAYRSPQCHPKASAPAFSMENGIRNPKSHNTINTTITYAHDKFIGFIAYIRLDKTRENKKLQQTSVT